MYHSKTLITSEHSARYLQTLCKHFARKVPSNWNQDNGKVNFAMGDCELKNLPETNQLELICSADSTEKLDTVKAILEQHVTMLSRRETINIAWK